jgi:hypothetical protein
MSAWDAGIETFMHCATCIDELPEGQSPAKYARLNIGGTPDGWLVIGCVRHGCEVAAFRTNGVTFHDGEIHDAAVRS